MKTYSCNLLSWSSLIFFFFWYFNAELSFWQAPDFPSSLTKVPIRFSPLPLGGFRQVFKAPAQWSEQRWSEPIRLRDTKNLWSASVMAAPRQMIYPIVYFVHRCNFTWKAGELALITDYWNEAKFKHKHPVAKLPASYNGILIYFRFQLFVHKV